MKNLFTILEKLKIQTSKLETQFEQAINLTAQDQIKVQIFQIDLCIFITTEEINEVEKEWRERNRKTN